MQTFLPYPSFKKSAECLDNSRLGKQRVEAKQILQCLLGEGSLRWKNHPAVKMWEGCELSLCTYGLIICNEWVGRGKKDTIKDFFEIKLKQIYESDSLHEGPSWLNNPEFHASHRSNLLRKGKRDYLWHLLGEEDRILKESKDMSFPMQKAKMKEDDWVRLENKFKEEPIVNHYANFGWVEPDNLGYYWPKGEESYGGKI